MVHYSGHGLNDTPKVGYSSHGLNTDPIVCYSCYIWECRDIFSTHIFFIFKKPGCSLQALYYISLIPNSRNLALPEIIWIWHSDPVRKIVLKN